MSLVLAFHDDKRAVVAADSRVTGTDATGKPTRIGTCPKFVTLPGGLIVGCIGRTEHAKRLLAGTQRIMGDYPKTSFADLASLLQFTVKKMWETRGPAAIRPEFDNLQTCLLGADRTEGKIRCLVWHSDQNFQVSDMSADPNARIFCAGYFEDADRPALQDLTDRMVHAERKGMPWIACQLRDTINHLSELHPDYVDAASDFAAIDRNGVVELPPEFPLPAANHFATEAHA